MLKKDNMAFGAMLGAIIPVIAYFLLELLTVTRGGVKMPMFSEGTIMVLSIFVNIIPFRQYMVKLKYDKTGRGILLVTFIYAFVYLFTKLN